MQCYVHAKVAKVEAHGYLDLHQQSRLLIGLLDTVITFEVAAVYGLSSSSITFSEVTSLDHKVLNNSVKCGAFIAQLFPCDFASPSFTSAQTQKVFACLGTNIRKKLEHYATNWLPVELYIKVTLRAVFHPHCDQSLGDLF